MNDINADQSVPAGDGQGRGEGAPDRTTDIFADERVRRYQATKDREVAEAQRKAAEAERAAQMAQRQYETLMRSIESIDPKAGTGVLNEIARDAELAALREFYETSQRDTEAQRQQREWRDYWRTELEDIGIDPYDPQVQKAMDTWDNDEMKRVRRELLRRPGVSSEAPPDRAEAIRQRTEAGEYTSIPQSGGSKPPSVRDQEMATEYIDALLTARNRRDLREQARLMNELQREHPQLMPVITERLSKIR